MITYDERVPVAAASEADATMAAVGPAIPMTVCNLEVEGDAVLVVEVVAAEVACLDLAIFAWSCWH